jgi:ankyrin repeat protein
LLGLGADVNAGEGDMFTPLHVAAAHGHAAVAEALLSGGNTAL